MKSPFTEHVRRIESQVNVLLTTAGWKQRRYECAASGSFYIGKTATTTSEFPDVQEFIGLWCDWKLDGALQLWPATLEPERIAQEVQAAAAASPYPEITFLTASCGTVHTGNPPDQVRKQVPFTDGPGLVDPYLVSIGERYYVLGNLEVPYASMALDSNGYPEKTVVLKACEAAIAAMRSTCAPGVIVFPVNFDKVPFRCVISAALPVREDAPAAVKERLANTFRGYQDIDKLLALAA